MKNRKYYAVISPKAVGVYDKWFIAEKVIRSSTKSEYMTFTTKGEAVGFISRRLTDDDWHDFCFDRCPIYVNKTFVRLKEYKAKRDALKSRREKA